MPTETNTAPAPTAAPIAQSEVKVDAHLASLYEQRANQDRNVFKQILTYVKDNNVKRAVVQFTLSEPFDKGGRNMTVGSAKTETSRIFTLLNPENKELFDNLMSDKITVEQARKAKSPTGSGGPKAGKNGPLDPYLTAIATAAGIAVNGESPISKDDFLATCAKAFDTAQSNKAIIDAGKVSGAVQSQGSVSASPATPAPAPANKTAKK